MAELAAGGPERGDHRFYEEEDDGADFIEYDEYEKKNLFLYGNIINLILMYNIKKIMTLTIPEEISVIVSSDAASGASN